MRYEETDEMTSEKYFKNFCNKWIEIRKCEKENEGTVFVVSSSD